MQWGGSQRKTHTKIQTEWNPECQRHSEAARETHNWRNREIYMKEKKKQVPGQIDTQGRVKHANKQPVRVSYIQSHLDQSKVSDM